MPESESRITDKHGREIMVGDTLKLYHFTGARRKKYFMYKFVMEEVGDKFFRLSHLDRHGGSYFMSILGKQRDDIEIVQGFGPDGKSFDRRPKRRALNATSY